MTWRYEIQYGPDGEGNYAWVYNDKGEMVCTTKTHHAIAIVERFTANVIAAPVTPQALTEGVADIQARLWNASGELAAHGGFDNHCRTCDEAATALASLAAELASLKQSIADGAPRPREEEAIMAEAAAIERAELAERKLEEQRKALEANISGDESELLIEWPCRVAISISKDEVGYAIIRNGNWEPGKHIIFSAPSDAAKEIASAIRSLAGDSK